MPRAAAARPRRLPLMRWLRRRRLTRWSLAAAILLLSLTIWGLGGIHRQLPPAWLEAGPVSVTRVDGDLTLHVRSADGLNETFLRLAGVSNENVYPACGPWLRERCALGPLVIEYAPSGATWAAEPWPVYAYDATGQMINEALINEGMARADAADRHRLARWFARLQRTAKDRGRGMWKE